MKALISILEQRETGYRVAEVVADSDVFDVAPDLFWVDCSNQIVRDEYWYDPADETIKAIPPRITTAEENKSRAMAVLARTDWVNQPDITNVDIDPHLLNYEEFVTFRSQIRAIAVNPVDGDLTWPTKPTPRWSTV